MPEETQEDGETGETWQWEGGAYCPETTAEREKKRETAKRVIALQQHLMASLERRRGRECRGGEWHNEGAMTEAKIDLER